MSLANKLKEKVVERAAEIAVTPIVVLLIWVGHELVPILLPLADSISKQIFLALLLASLLINVLLAFLISVATKKPPFRLKYGIYWDAEKNPHCPSCKTPVAGYAQYSIGAGYQCKPCGKIYPLTDADGNDIKPSRVIGEL
jgi:hypothetical protein